MPIRSHNQKDNRIKDFVLLFSKPKPKQMTIEDFLSMNHEIWRKCDCGEVWDAKIDGYHCPKCGRNTKVKSKS